MCVSDESKGAGEEEQAGLQLERVALEEEQVVVVVENYGSWRFLASQERQDTP